MNETMNETVRLWSPNYEQLLFTTGDREAAKAFFLASDHEWLPIVIDYGPSWQQRWSGRIERNGDVTEIHQDHKYLEYMMQWPTKLDLQAVNILDGDNPHTCTFDDFGPDSECRRCWD